jgi:hypothetical protein
MHFQTKNTFEKHLKVEAITFPNGHFYKNFHFLFSFFIEISIVYF